MNNEEFKNYISSLSKEQLINKVYTYKSLYETKIIEKNEYEDLCEILNGEIKYYLKKSSDLEEKYEKAKKELQVHKILERHQEKDNEEKRITKFASNFLASCCSCSYFYFFLNNTIDISFGYFILLLIPLFFICLIINVFLFGICVLLYQVVKDHKEKLIDLFAHLLPFLITMSILIFTTFF